MSYLEIPTKGKKTANMKKRSEEITQKKKKNITALSYFNQLIVYGSLY